MSDASVNSAARLLAFLRAAMAKSDKQRIREVLADSFQLQPADNGAMLEALTHLIGLVQQTKRDVAAIPGITNDLYMQPFDKLERALASTSLEHPWQHFKQNLDERTMTALEFGADTLAKHVAEEEIPQEELLNLRHEVDELVDQVMGASVQKELKEALLACLETMRQAILFYSLRGAAGLRESMERCFGLMIIYQKQYRDMEKAPPDTEEHGVMARFTKIVLRVDAILSVALKVKEIAGPFVRLIQSGGQQ